MPSARITLVPLACLFIAGSPLLSGCLGEPGIEERWTLLELYEPNVETSIAPGTTSIDVKGQVTYRSILTGSVVAEVRVSTVLGYDDVDFDPSRPRLEVLEDVDRILANSTSAGFGVVPFTGWDHLIQDVNVTFTADIPTDSTQGAVFLLLYLADAEEVELPTGEEILIIYPFDFNQTEVLPIGLEITPEVSS